MSTELRRLAFGLAALVSCGWTLAAQARSVSAFAGRAIMPEDAGCFHGSAANIYNDRCPGASPYYWEVSLPVDSAGWHGIDLVTGMGIGPADCVAFSVDQSGTPASIDMMPSLSTGTTSPTRHFSVWVPSGGTLQVYCKLPYATVNGGFGGMRTVNWNP
jgi:hypothetical protein